MVFKTNYKKEWATGMTTQSKMEGLHKPTTASFSKYKYLLKELVRKNIKLRYRNSVLGVLWTFLQPLLNMLVLVFIFGSLFGRDSADVKDYPVYLLCGRLIFDFYSQATKQSMNSIVGNAGIIKKVYVPKYIYPLSNVLSSFVTFLISLTVLVVVMIVRKVGGGDIQITPYIFLVVIPIAILLLLCMGIGYILSTLLVFFRDVGYLYDVFCTLLFYFTPIFYTPKQLGLQGFALTVLRANPLYGIVNMFRDCVLFGQMLNWKQFLYTLIFSSVLMLIGYYAFKRTQNKFILHI